MSNSRQNQYRRVPNNNNGAQSAQTNNNAARQSRISNNAAGPSGTSNNAARQSRISNNAAGPSGTSNNAAGPSGTSNNAAGPSGTSNNAARPFQRNNNAAGPSGTSNNAARPFQRNNNAARPSQTNNNAARPSLTNNNLLLPPPPSYANAIKLQNVTSTPPLRINHGNTTANNLVLQHDHVGREQLLTALSGNHRESPQRGIVQRTPIKYLSNWSVIADRKQISPGHTVLEIAISGSLLADNRITISEENHNAGKLSYLKTKYIVKTNNGTYHLIGPIARGYPSNLYLACLQTRGIPKTWKYLLTQFTGMPTSYNQSLARCGDFFNNPKLVSLFNKNEFIRKLLIITKERIKGFGTSPNPSNICVFLFNRKLIESAKVIEQLLAEIIKEEELSA